MKKLIHYNYKEIFRSLRFALSPKKLILLYPLSLLMYLLLDSFNYVLFVLTIIYYIFSKIAISKITYEEIKGDYFYEMQKAIVFSAKSILRFFGFLLIIFISFSLLIILIFLLTLIAKLHIAILYLTFPLILFLSILVIYLLLGTTLSETIGMACISTQNFDSFDVFFETFSMLNNQIYRVISYKITSIITAVFGTIFLFAFLYTCVSIINVFLKLEHTHTLYILTYLIAPTYGLSTLFISDLFSYILLVYKRDNFDLSSIEPEIHSQRT
ncbi:MAG: hypothetical protein N2504_04090 [candidate division WOR-3 bacterium]|nr:hypothetical protein [candidate division WOR-3 bacterium]MCX7947748.1 hypothetical protein [candidate division WOR-3 bacterium]MDW8150329.1 hypothetical protein [candidate division WOR-3 bacterium]